jgi:hypothetical protein
LEIRIAGDDSSYKVLLEVYHSTTYEYKSSLLYAPSDTITRKTIA